MSKFHVGDIVRYKKNVAEEHGLPKSEAVIQEIKINEDRRGGEDFYFLKFPDADKVECVNGKYIELCIDLLSRGKASEDFENNQKPTTVCILGTKYTIVEKPLKDCDGYCDKTTKEIAIATKDDDCDMGNFEEYRKKVLRHEIIHAYHHESGLDNNLENKPYGFSETLVDWFAIQSTKIFKTFKELDIL